MLDSIADRLTVLRQELAAGERQLEALEQRRGELRATMLRISGAIQVLDELLAEARSTPEEQAAQAG